MKKLLTFITIILFSLNVNAQVDSLTGCMGIKFGSSTSKVKSMVTSKNAGFNLYHNQTDLVSYTEGTFACRSCIGAIFSFHDDKLHTIKILLESKYDPKCYDLYLEVREELSKKYGIEPNEIHKYRSPYREGDGYISTGIKLGYIDIASYFNFPDGNVLTIEITKSLSIMLVYQDTNLASTAIEEKNKDLNKDY